MTDKNREFPAAARAKAIELDAIFAECAADVAKLEARLEKLGFGKDSIGQWFYRDQMIPYPPAAAASGIQPMK